jgi:hypothetical protein
VAGGPTNKFTTEKHMSITHLIKSLTEETTNKDLKDSLKKFAVTGAVSASMFTALYEIGSHNIAIRNFTTNNTPSSALRNVSQGATRFLTKSIMIYRP